MSRFLLILVMLPLPSFAQFDPANAHVNLYFPHLADGGTRAQQWQTSFVFMNPHPTESVDVSLWTYNDAGAPLPLDLGLGLGDSVSFSIPPSGTRTLRSNIASDTIVTGWAIAYTTLPVQATVLFRAIQNGVPLVEISAAAALPSRSYWSSANNSLGVALANAGSSSIRALLNAYDQDGRLAASARYNLGTFAHGSFTLGTLMPSLPADFSGSLRIDAGKTDDRLVAWTLNADRGLVASLPAGQAAWPVSHWDRIWLVWCKVLSAAQTALGPLGIDMKNPPINLHIPSGSGAIDAFASLDGENVTLTLSLSELISDSPSELAFAAAHELGHIAQIRAGQVPDELDADRIGMLLAMIAGYDPYAGAGTLAKYSMAADSGSLGSQLKAEATDVHRSFNTRIANMYGLLKDLCSDPQSSSFCTDYKSKIHPHFPGFVPLKRPAGVSEVPSPAAQPPSDPRRWPTPRSEAKTR